MLINLLTGLLISVVIQVVFFAFAVFYRTDKFTDLSYGVTFISVTLFFYFFKSNFQLNQTLLVLMVVIWGVRLATYLFIRILKTNKDMRFDNIRNDFWKFAKFWLFQAITIWIILLPTQIVLSKNMVISVNANMIGGLLIWIVGFIIESISDQQKFSFKNKKENEGSWISKGLWKYSRHPNYFGEILCWWGIFIMTIPVLSGWLHLSIISPIFISVIIIFVSGLPPLEKKYNIQYKDNINYKKYKKNTNVLVLFPFKLW